VDVLVLVVAVFAVVAIFATTQRGREMRKRVGFRDTVSGAAPTDDVAYLVQLCEGDRDEAARRVAAERDRFPDLTEADHYRRAIRKGVNERDARPPS